MTSSIPLEAGRGASQVAAAAIHSLWSRWGGVEGIGLGWDGKVRRGAACPNWISGSRRDSERRPLMRAVIYSNLTTAAPGEFRLPRGFHTKETP